MREFKFRIWKSEKEMMRPIDGFTCNWERDFHTNTSELIIKKTDILMQYTGLKDENGKEIYEGDIILALSVFNFPERGKVLMCIEYKKENNSLSPREFKENYRGGRYWNSFDILFDIEIIGNIYENPELLEN